MLQRLSISNLVLIRQAELDLSEGLTCVTGETGAGKTIFAQAVGLLLGAPGDAKLVGPHGNETFVEGEFVVPDELWADEALAPLDDLRPEGEQTLVVARKLAADGRSRALAWGRTISRETLAAATERLLAVSGQFEQRRLARSAYQLDLLDSYIGRSQSELRHGTADAWAALTAARRTHDEIGRDHEAAQLRFEGMRMLVEAASSFLPGEDAELYAELQLLSASHDLLAAADRAVSCVSPEDGAGSADQAAQAAQALDAFAGFAPELDQAAQGFREAELLLRDHASELHRYVATVSANPARLEEIEARLSEIADAKRRFREPDYERLVARVAEAVDELARLEGDNDPLAAAQRALTAAQTAYDALASKLTAARCKAAPAFSKAAVAELRELAMGDGEFKVELNQRPASASGVDEAVFLIRPNKGLPFAAASQVASGGELSRIALALRIVARTQTDAPSILFDEIDAGIGGVTAHAVAAALGKLSKDAQVIVITHLAQVAKLADNHLKIEKTAADTALTEIVPLDPAARKTELQRMGGGEAFLAELAS
jgi:DNA repair protein RecN (Recombination protein N)